MIVYAAAEQAVYVGLAGFVLFRRLAEVRSQYRAMPNVRAALGRDVADMRLLIAAAYLLISTLMLVLVAKSGSSINYFLEWFFALGLFAAMAPSEAIRGTRGKAERQTILAIGIPIALAIEVALHRMRDPTLAGTPRAHASWRSCLPRSLQPTNRSISDDMVLLIRSGREVLWEPAIFAELASTGDWDERPFVQRIRNGEFAFFITSGRRGHQRFDERYNPAVAEAIDAAYPVKEETAGLVIHRSRPQSTVALRH